MATDRSHRRYVPTPIWVVALAVLAFVAACGEPARSPAGGVGSPNATDAGGAPSAPTSPTGSSSAGPIPTGPASGPPPALALEVVADGLESPLDIAVHPRDPAAMLVAEQVGRIQVVRDGVLADEPMLDISDHVTVGGESGLLGVAPHPDPADDRVFVYYTSADADQVVSSFRLDPDDPDRLLADSERQLLLMDDPFGNHNGGSLAFGPDGYLYIGTGDGGGGGDPLGSGRSLDTLLAKVLRVDIDAPADQDPPYGIPADNPFADGGGRPEIWATGLRNPWRFRFDPATGDLWIGDVGQGSFEEIDRIPSGEGGLDFGWNTMEGFECFERDTCDAAGLTLPLLAYDHDEGCSVTGGMVYRGTTQPGLTGRYVFADYCSGRMWTVDAATASPATPDDALDSGRQISAIAAGPDGEPYATDLSAGELLRIVVAD